MIGRSELEVYSWITIWIGRGRDGYGRGGIVDLV